MQSEIAAGNRRSQRQVPQLAVQLCSSNALSHSPTVSGKALAAGKKEDADPKISGDRYSTHTTGVGPNAIRAERSEQEEKLKSD